MSRAHLITVLALIFTCLTWGCDSDPEGDPDSGTDTRIEMDIADTSADTALADTNGEDTEGSDADMGGDASPFPTPVSVLVSRTFDRGEGITFNGEGSLFVMADTDVWQISTEGEATLVVDLVAPVGLAGIGDRDILVADFGPLTFLDDGPNDDGVVWRVTPEGEATEIATGIGDPNFIHVREDQTLLVTDDFTDIIYEVTLEGEVSVFLQGIQAPNGLVESLDGETLFVVQTFSSWDPLEFDARVWQVPLDGDGRPGTPEVLAEIDGFGANDGVTLDAEGRLYVAANADGEIWRIDPRDGSQTLIATRLLTVASLAFGEGSFNAESIYATQLFGGKVWEVPVGVEGASMNR